MNENDKTRAHIGQTISEIEQNPMARIATDPDDIEAYEIIRRIERTLERNKTKPTG